MGQQFELDIIVVGAGISGIAASKCYLDLHPHARLIILDRDDCVGGTWNSRRGYDTFWTQWTVGTAEFSDQAMVRPPDEDLHFEFFKAKHTTKYLESYVDQHSYSGQTLRDRIKLSIEVNSVLKNDSYWTVSATERAGGLAHTFRASKLIIASGLTSIPNMPTIPGNEEFQGQLLHHDAFGSSNVLHSPEVQDIVVLGAGKSSADMVYEAAKAKKAVSWIMKATDTTGPGFFLPPAGKGPYKNAFEIGMTRIADGNFGRKCLQNFDKLEPHSLLFWQNCTGGLLNHEDFYETVASNVRIFCGDVDRLGKYTLCLKTGEEIRCDAVLCGTGWIPSLQFFTENQCQELGLPHNVDLKSEDDKTQWAELEAEADRKVLATFPQLANPPPHYHKPVTHSPYRLYRNLVPISEAGGAIHDRSIVFVGQIGVGNYFPMLECQSLWAAAYLDGRLALPSKEEQEKDVARFTTWCRRRYLSSGEEGNNMIFELIGYMDLLLRDLKLNSHRKGWFKDLFAPLWAKDLKGLRGEFEKKFGYDETDK